MQVGKKKKAREGLRVVIIGGGPGGTACALALHKLAAEKSIPLDITILEGEDFTPQQHHNLCVGVLSPPLPSLLEETLVVPFPRDICLGNIDRYILQSGGEQVLLDDNGEPSVAVKRVEFDAYMLEQVLTRKINVYPFRAVDLEFHADSVIVFTENEAVECDVIVGAFGLDEDSAAMFSHNTPYRQPRHLESIVVNLPFNDFDRQAYGTSIHAFLPSNHRIEFGAITPKCDHLTVNIAGKRVDIPLMHTFLEMPEVINVLCGEEKPHDLDWETLNYYKGRFPRSVARGFYGDRYVMVGDASGLVRAFKGKGVTTAMLTGVRAAETILNHGFSEQAFQSHYRRANRDIIRDLPYGRGVRLLTLTLSNYGFMGPVLRAAQKSTGLKSALFGAVSGHTPYRDILKQVLHPKVIRDIVGSIR
jgi:flavin-dependent dehydrogenase